MNKIIVLNHKMNMLYEDIYTYIEELNNLKTEANIIICPSSIYLIEFINNTNWAVGCQNLYYEEYGSYTGELSTNQLKSIGVEYTLIGHYERRKYFNESIIEINKKLIAALNGNILPILCIQNEKELEQILKGINHIEFIIFAYEPPKLIGLGKIENVEDIKKEVTKIHEYLKNKYQVTPTIIYGGSVNEENINTIKNIENLNGVLIGSTSVDIEKTKKIIEQI